MSFGRFSGSILARRDYARKLDTHVTFQGLPRLISAAWFIFGFDPFYRPRPPTARTKADNPHPNGCCKSQPLDLGWLHRLSRALGSGWHFDQGDLLFRARMRRLVSHAGLQVPEADRH